MTRKMQQPGKRPLSLAPLKFDEAVTDLLKVGPMPKPAKVKPKAKKRAKSS